MPREKKIDYKPRVKGEVYGLTKKIEVLKILQQNNFSYAKTAKQTGISQGLIFGWHSELGGKIFGQTAVDIATETHQYAQKSDMKFIDRIHELRKKVSDKMEKCIDACDVNENKDRWYILQAFKIINDVATADKAADQPQQHFNLIQMIENKNKVIINEDQSNGQVTSTIVPVSNKKQK
jgi:hypothetical protein